MKKNIKSKRIQHRLNRENYKTYKYKRAWWAYNVAKLFWASKKPVDLIIDTLEETICFCFLPHGKVEEWDGLGPYQILDIIDDYALEYQEVNSAQQVAKLTEILNLYDVKNIRVL